MYLLATSHTNNGSIFEQFFSPLHLNLTVEKKSQSAMFVDTEPLRHRSSALAENIGVYMNTLGFSKGLCREACVPGRVQISAFLFLQ